MSLNVICLHTRDKLNMINVISRGQSTLALLWVRGLIKRYPSIGKVLVFEIEYYGSAAWEAVDRA